MIFKLTLAAALLATATTAMAQDAHNPVVAKFGRINPAPDAAMQPDPSLDYRVAFNVTKAPSDPKMVNPSLDKVARYLNLLAAGKVSPKPGNILAVVHGPATELVLSHKAYRAKHGMDNPNLALVEALRKAGAEVHVCSQALAGQRIAKADVASLVTVDLSALTTLTTLQMKGWSVMND